MIDINLLIKPPPRLRWSVVFRTVGAVVLIAGACFYAYIGLSRLDRLRREEAALRALLAAYAERGASLASTQEAVRELESYLAAVAELGRNQRFSQADVLQAIGVLPEGVRLTRVTFADGAVTIGGVADRFAAANQYLLNLRALPLVAAVEEVSATKQADGLTEFTYRVRLRNGGEQP